MAKMHATAIEIMLDVAAHQHRSLGGPLTAEELARLKQHLQEFPRSEDIHEYGREEQFPCTRMNCPNCGGPLAVIDWDDYQIVKGRADELQAERHRRAPRAIARGEPSVSDEELLAGGQTPAG